MAALSVKTGDNVTTIETIDAIPEFSPYLVIRAGGAKRYIALVSTANPYASNIRVRIGGTTYALAFKVPDNPDDVDYDLLNSNDLNYVFAKQSASSSLSSDDLNFIFK